jgi:excisionase family DNA binding protein
MAEHVMASGAQPPWQQHEPREEQDQELFPRDLYGAQAAARMLNIHRSTLHLAVRRGELIPDKTTPGGHVRFTRETLDAFAARLTHEPATTSTRVLSALARTLAVPNGPEEFCHLTFARIRQALPDLTILGVGLRHPTPDDPHNINPVAQEGLAPGIVERFRQLRPGTEFASTAVFRTRAPEVCEDTTLAPAVRLGAWGLARRAGLGAYAVLPLVVGSAAAGDTVLGVLVVASPWPRHFPQSDIAFLQSIANDLGVALAYHGQLTRLRSHSRAAIELTQCALKLRTALYALPADASAARTTARARAIETLRQLYLERSSAEHVDMIGLDRGRAGRELDGAGDTGEHRLGWDGAAGPARRGAGATPQQLLDLMEHVHDAGPIQRAQWEETDGVRAGIAMTLPLSREHVVTVGATWRGDSSERVAEEALLAAFGTACILALGLNAPTGLLPEPPFADAN